MPVQTVWNRHFGAYPFLSKHEETVDGKTTSLTRLENLQQNQGGRPSASTVWVSEMTGKRDPKKKQFSPGIYLRNFIWIWDLQMKVPTFVVQPLFILQGL